MRIFIYGSYKSDFKTKKDLTGMDVATHCFIDALSKIAEITMLNVTGSCETHKLKHILNEDVVRKKPSTKVLWRKRDILRNYFLEENYDAVILNQPHFKAFSSFQEVTGNPVIIRCHGLTITTGEMDRILACASIARPCDAICFPTKWVRDYVAEFLQSDSMLRVFPNGVDINHFKPFSKDTAKKKLFNRIKWGNPKVHVIGYVGRLEPEKGIIPFLDSARLLPNSLFVLVGEKYGYYELLSNPNVIHVGPKPYEVLPEFYNAFDVFCFPSVGGPETFGMSCLEAMACGVVPIVLENTAPAEVASDCGILVENEILSKTFCGITNAVSGGCLSERISWILNNQKTRDGLSSKAVIKAKEYDWGNIAGKVIELIQELKREKATGILHKKKKIMARFVPSLNYSDNQMQTTCVLYDPNYSRLHDQPPQISCDEGLALNMILGGHTKEEIMQVLSKYCGAEESKRTVENTYLFLRAYEAAYAPNDNRRNS